MFKLSFLKNTPETKHIPVIILSAIHQPKDIERAMKLGAVNYLGKDQVIFSDVVEVIEKTLDYHK